MIVTDEDIALYVLRNIYIAIHSPTEFLTYHSQRTHHFYTRSDAKIVLYQVERMLSPSDFLSLIVGEFLDINDRDVLEGIGDWQKNLLQNLFSMIKSECDN